MKQFLILTSALVVMTAVVASPVMADGTSEQSQESRSKSEVVCKTGSYGQITCRAESEAEAKQTQIVRAEKVHKTVDAALDTKTLAVVAGSLMSGAAGVTLRIVTRT